MARAKKPSKLIQFDNNSSTLEQALNQIEKQFGKGAIMHLDENSISCVDGISTGALSLDIALGGRGIPRGRVVELFGPESGGKTTLALHMVAQAQKKGGVAAFIDAEHALDPGPPRNLCGEMKIASIDGSSSPCGFGFMSTST